MCSELDDSCCSILGSSNSDRSHWAPPSTRPTHRLIPAQTRHKTRRAVSQADLTNTVQTSITLPELLHLTQPPRATRTDTLQAALELIPA